LPALVLIGAGVEVTRVATELRSSGVPVLHLAEDLALEAAFAYARSVEAAWVAYPAPEGLKLAPVRAGGEFELTPTEKVAGRVLS
jgi:ATP phosphoribosyltransferase regulatory subunit